MLSGWALSFIIVKILTGVFDPPPPHLFVPWAYLAALGGVTCGPSWPLEPVSSARCAVPLPMPSGTFNGPACMGRRAASQVAARRRLPRFAQNRAASGYSTPLNW